MRAADRPLHIGGHPHDVWLLIAAGPHSRKTPLGTRSGETTGQRLGALYLMVETYPTVTFQSSHVARTAPNTYDVTGTLTVRGVAREITLPVTYLGTAQDPWGNARAGFETEITINRKDFGLAWNAALETGGFLVGDDVRISLSIQAIAQALAMQR